MKDLYIPADTENDTPMVDFKLNGTLKLEGKSFPEDPYRFYEPVFQWVKDFRNECPAKITVTVKLDYFNTSTSKVVLYFFKMLEVMHTSGETQVKITWLYNKNDEDMIESGKDYGSLIDVPFESKEFE